MFRIDILLTSATYLSSDDRHVELADHRTSYSELLVKSVRVSAIGLNWVVVALVGYFEWWLLEWVVVYVEGCEGIS
jgi:hypothetical protein